MVVQRFSYRHGENIRLNKEGTVALRESSFSHGICFSDKPLRPRELFLIEIDKNELGWRGHLRIGLTQLDPYDVNPLPEYALPHLKTVQDKKSWIFALKNSVTNPTEGANDDIAEEASSRHNSRQSIFGNSETLVSHSGLISRHWLSAALRQEPVPAQEPAYGMPMDANLLDDDDEAEPTANPDSVALPTDVGSRIGVIYDVRGDTADMHVIVNGVDNGPCATGIPYREAQLYVVVDVYGSTKQVRILQHDSTWSMKNLCCLAVLKNLKNTNDIEELEIPKSLKQYMQEYIGATDTNLANQKRFLHVISGPVISGLLLEILLIKSKNSLDKLFTDKPIESMCRYL